MNGIPVEIHLLQGMGLRVEKVTDGEAVALIEDAVGRGVHRCATLPDDASRTVALVADEQAGIKVRTDMAVAALDERIGHDTGLVATDGRHIFLTDDT